MPTLLPHKIEKENPAQKWGNLVVKSERAVGSNLIIYSDLSRRSSPQPLPRHPHWLGLRNLITWFNPLGLGFISRASSSLIRCFLLFLRCREWLLPAAEAKRHHLSFAASCFHHRDHPRPVFAAASYRVDPVSLQPTLPPPSFNFSTSSCCWGRASSSFIRCFLLFLRCREQTDTTFSLI